MEERIEFKSAVRDHGSLLASVEKRALIWMAERMPGWVNSDHLTALGFASLLAVGASYWYAKYSQAGLIWAIVFLVVNWFGDSLDGTLARYRNKQRPRYGFYVDHIIDVLGAFAIMTGLAFSGHITPMVAAALLVAFLMFSAETYLATYSVGRFKLSYMKFGPTEIRLLLMIGNIFALYHPVAHVFHKPFKFFDVGCSVAAACMFITLLMSAAKNIRFLYNAERV